MTLPHNSRCEKWPQSGKISKFENFFKKNYVTKIGKEICSVFKRFFTDIVGSLDFQKSKLDCSAQRDLFVEQRLILKLSSEKI